MKKFILLIFVVLGTIIISTATCAVVESCKIQHTAQSTIRMGTDFVNDEIIHFANIPAVDQTDIPEEQPKNFWGLLLEYWAELLLSIMALIKIIVRITPTIKDDKVFGWLDKLIEFIIPNFERK